jgi:hypothetical protein
MSFKFATLLVCLKYARTFFYILFPNICQKDALFRHHLQQKLN